MQFAGTYGKKLWDLSRKMGDQVENSTREQIYYKRMGEGKTTREAAFEAKDLLDFSLHGNFTAIRGIERHRAVLQCGAAGHVQDGPGIRQQGLAPADNPARRCDRRGVHTAAHDEQGR